MSELIPRRVLRYICPYCHRGHSNRPAGERHMARCFKNPAARGCKTCASYQPAEKADYEPGGYPGCAESCDAGLTVMRTNCELWERTSLLQRLDCFHRAGMAR